MKAIVSGGGGQLAAEFVRRSGYTVLGKSDLDVTDRENVFSVIDRLRPDLVINAAAYTAVDRAESDPERAMSVNRDGPRHLSEACLAVGSRLVHVSTDYVFRGNGSSPISPGATGDAESVYGRSKWQGEEAVREVLGDSAMVVRTAWLYAAGHLNFVSAMLRLMREREEIGVVADQIGTPTWSRTLADGIARLVERGSTGTQHLTDSGVASWYDFAVAIESIGRERGLLASGCRIRPIRSADFPARAKRPMYAVLDKSATFDSLGGPAPHWRESLASCLAEWRDPS